MPITVTYDITDLKNDNEHSRIVSAFVRLGWEHVGGSTLRYPRFDCDGVEDWLNCVVPALFFLRSFVLAKEITLSKFTLDTHSVSWKDGQRGAPLPLGGDSLGLETVPDAKNHFGEKNLRNWVAGTIDTLK